jgi:hypothetical protein
MNGLAVKVNIKDHFKKFHNLDVDNLDGIALMTDTDNSELLAISYYQNIFFSTN